MKYTTDILSEIQTWCHYADTIVVQTYDVLFNTVDNPTKVYLYQVASKNSILLDVPEITNVSPDIAHTGTKMWLFSDNTNSIVKEWDITLSPASFIYNRSIQLTGMSAGLSAINNTTLNNRRWVDAVTRIITEEDITSSPSTTTDKWYLPSNREITGDYLLTTTNKFIALNYLGASPWTRYITQFDYTTGSVEFDIELPSYMLFSYGLFVYDSEMYIATIDITNTFSEIYHIQKTAPYTLTLYDTLDYRINGASQIPEQLTVHFI